MKYLRNQKERIMKHENDFAIRLYHTADKYIYYTHPSCPRL